MTIHDIKSEADIKLLVDSFYNKVLKDETIGFIFNDVAAISMEKHMPIMYSFWSSVLLGERGYTGNPMTKHIELDKKVTLTPEHFKRWFELWEQTVNENFVGKTADEAIARAKNIATLMQYNVEQSRTKK